jgi:hypothetical protein
MCETCLIAELARKGLLNGDGTNPARVRFGYPNTCQSRLKTAAMRRSFMATRKRSPQGDSS